MIKSKVKVCGITCRRNLKTFIDLPIDFIGLNFVERSKRKIKKDKAKKIVESLPSRIKPVLILEDHDLEDAIKLIKDLKVKYVQLHGQESVDYCKKLKNLSCKPKAISLKIIKAFPCSESTVKDFDKYKTCCNYFLIDSSSNGKMGGTGKTVDWKVARKISNKAEKLKVPIFLAGGLTPQNVQEAIKEVSPDYIDINSGFESSIGKKDKEKINKLFI